MIPLIVMAASALAQYYASRNAGRASTQAAQTQADASNQAIGANSQAQQAALDLYERIYNQSRQDAAPWLQMGQHATGALSHMAGLPSSYNDRTQLRLGNGGTQTMGQTYGNRFNLPGAPVSTYRPPQMVTLEAPSGERMQVPANMAQGYISQGARRVG